MINIEDIREQVMLIVTRSKWVDNPDFDWIVFKITELSIQYFNGLNDITDSNIYYYLESLKTIIDNDKIIEDIISLKK